MENLIIEPNKFYKTKSGKKEKSDFDAKGELLKLGVEDQIANDFLLVRKNKRSPLTQTALSGITNQAKEAKMSLNDVLKLCCQNNWQGFKASWIPKQENNLGKYV